MPVQLVFGGDVAFVQRGVVAVGGAGSSRTSFAPASLSLPPGVIFRIEWRTSRDRITRASRTIPSSALS
jgi:hypothetical protein